MGEKSANTLAYGVSFQLGCNHELEPIQEEAQASPGRAAQERLAESTRAERSAEGLQAQPTAAAHVKEPQREQAHRTDAMSTQKPRVTIEVTERELNYLLRVTDYPYSQLPQLATKLGDAHQAMQLAKREYNRALKQARNEKRLSRDDA
jgi:hypothetical protein